MAENNIDNTVKLVIQNDPLDINNEHLEKIMRQKHYYYTHISHNEATSPRPT